jgi:putative ABC transport system permease protein
MGGSILIILSSTTGIPYTPIEGLYILAIVFVLLGVVIILSIIKKLRIGKEFTYAIVKGGLQLSGISMFLTFLFDLEYWYFLIWVLIIGMVLFGGYTSAKRATGLKGAYKITTPAILVGSTVVLIVLAVSSAMPLKPQFIVPLAGMAFGNSMAICSICLDRLLREVKLNRTAIETALSLGADSKKALEDYGKMSIRASLIPTIDRLKTLGIIFIPGAMSGLLIAGTDPLVAAEYQIIVYLMIVGGGIITAILVGMFVRKKLFNSAEQLAEWL